MKTVVEYDAVVDGPHHQALMEDPEFIKLHLAVLNAQAAYIATKAGHKAPTITGHIVSVHH